MTTAREGFIEADKDVRLYFRTVGQGEGVLIPLVSWTEEFDVLAKGRRLIFYDPRNRGAPTEVESGRISFRNDVRDLEEVRKHFALEKISLIGWSYFGGVVARYAMEFPERVERLVMVCGTPIRRLPYIIATRSTEPWQIELTPLHRDFSRSCRQPLLLHQRSYKNFGIC
jgi:pimeloyl-ACP methyl ester carboxylesterase